MFQGFEGRFRLYWVAKGKGLTCRVQQTECCSRCRLLVAPDGQHKTTYTYLHVPSLPPTFRQHHHQDEDNYSGFVEFMDDEGGAGWQLLEALMTGQTAAGELLRTARLFSAGAATEGSSSSSGGNPVA